MEGKERFTDLHYLDNQIFVYDNKLKSKRVIGIEECFELLNQQDARVKELEKIRDKGNQKLENFYNEKIDRLDSDYNKHFNELIEENQQLEQQLAEKKEKIETILRENEKLVVKYNVYNYGDKIQQDKAYSITGEALDLLINRQNQKAIEVLQRLRKKFEPYYLGSKQFYLAGEVMREIDIQIGKIKGLGGGENE